MRLLGSIVGGFVLTFLIILVWQNFSILLLSIIVVSMITGVLAAVTSESNDNFAGILLGCSSAIMIAIPLLNSVQWIHVFGLVMGMISSNFIIKSLSDN
jgi:hypothetical protein